VRRLALGDYAVDGRLLVERKTLHDLTESIKDGRLFYQACKLAEEPLRSLIILEGTVRGLKASRMRRESLQGALIALTVYRARISRQADWSKLTSSVRSEYCIEIWTWWLSTVCPVRFLAQSGFASWTISLEP